MSGGTGAQDATGRAEAGRGAHGAAARDRGGTRRARARGDREPLRTVGRVGALALLLGACAGPGASTRDEASLRGAAERGSREAVRKLAVRIACGHVRSGAADGARRGDAAGDGPTLEAAAGYLRGLEAPAPRDRALRLHVAEARGRLRAAFEGWRAMALAGAPPEASTAAAGEREPGARPPPWLVDHAARRARRLLDRIALREGDLGTLDKQLEASGTAASEAGGGPEGGLAARRAAVVELVAALARRLDRSRMLEAALRARGWIQRYARTRRLAPDPALAFQRSADASIGADAGREREPTGSTARGVLAWPEDGAGLYAGRVALPDGLPGEGPLRVTVISDASVRLLRGAAERRGEPGADRREAGILANERVRRHGPRRVRARLTGATPAELRVRVAGRAAAPRARVAVRRAVGPEGEPPREHLLGRLAALERALSDGSLHGAARASDALGACALAATLQARFDRFDPARPAEAAAGRRAERLDEALQRLPDHAGARAMRIRDLLRSGRVDEASALRRAGPVGEAGRALEVAMARARDERARAGRLARERVEAQPRSCDAWRELLEIRAARLRHRPEVLERTLPRCPDLLLQRARILRRARRFEAAGEGLARLEARLPAGRFAARVRRERARLALARGDASRAVRAVCRGLEEEVRRGPLLEVGVRAARLAGDDRRARRWRRRLLRARGVSIEARRSALDPSRDLSLPLAEGQALARRAHARFASGEVPGDVPVEVLHRARHTRVLPDGTRIRRTHRVFQLLGEAATESWGEQPLPEGAEVLVARTWQAGAEGPEPVEAAVPDRSGAISLRGLEPGAVGEVAWYRIERGDPVLEPGWALERFDLQRPDARVRRARWSLEAPEGGAVRLRRTRPDALEVERRAGPRGRRTVVTARQLAPAPDEAGDPRPDRRRAGVRALGGLSREELRARYRDELLWRTRPAPALERMAEDALAGAEAGRRARLAALHGTVLEHVGGGGGGLWSDHAAFAAARGRGSAALLLLGLCRTAELPAELLLARPRSRGEPDPEGAPGLGGEPRDWTHALIRASGPDGPIWLDTSSRWVPTGLVPPLVQGVPALRLGAGEAIARTPDPSAPQGEHRIRLRVEVTRSERGPEAGGGSRWGMRVRGRERLTGVHGMGWRHTLDEHGEAMRRRVLRRVIRRSVPSATVEELEVSGLEARGEPLRLRWRARSEAVRRSAIGIGLSPEQLAERVVEGGSRRTPLLQEDRANVRVRARIRPPEGWRLAGLAEPVAIEVPPLTYRREVDRAEDGRGVVATKRFRMHPALVAPATYPRWSRAAHVVDRADVLRLRLEPLRSRRPPGATSRAGRQ